MWAQPRTTLRAILQINPRQSVFFLAAIYMFHNLFLFANFYSMGLEVDSYFILLSIFVLAFPLGAVWLYFSGWVLHFTGKWLGGSAPALHLRAARAWSIVPYTINAVMWIILMIGNSDRVFIQSATGVSLVFINLITFILWLWSFVLFVQSLREVQNFSALRALVNTVLFLVVSFVILVLSWICVYFIYSFFFN